MFKAGDAVAKIDGYIVAVKDGGGRIGSRVMVRIESAGRNEAEAVIVPSGADSEQAGVGGRETVS